jgi:hypothetical protein
VRVTQAKGRGAECGVRDDARHVHVSLKPPGKRDRITLDDDIDIERWAAEENVANRPADEVCGCASFLTVRDQVENRSSRRFGEISQPLIDKFWLFSQIPSLLLSHALTAFSDHQYH